MVLTKADSDNVQRVALAATELRNALRLLREGAAGWRPPVLSCSALTGEGLDEVWQAVVGFKEHMERSGQWEARRQAQLLSWVTATAEQEVLATFHARQDPAERARIDAALADGTLAPYAAVRKLLALAHHRGH